MIGRSRFYVDEQHDTRGTHGESLQSTLVEGNIIKLYLKDGKVITGKSTFAKGSPENPMSYEEVAEKFRGNAAFANWPRQKAESVIETVKSLETWKDLSKLAAALTV